VKLFTEGDSICSCRYASSTVDSAEERRRRASALQLVTHRLLQLRIVYVSHFSEEEEESIC